MATLALLLIVCFQEADRLVADLDADSIETREVAMRRLMELGPAALRALLRAEATGSFEQRVRVRATLDAVRGLCDERERKLRLVTVQADDVRVGHVLRLMENQAGLLRWDSIDFLRLVSLDARAMPLREALARIGLAIDDENRVVARVGQAPPTSYFEGGEFTFTRERHRSGVIVRTTMRTDFAGQMEVDVVSVRAGRDLPVERCAKHSPWMVFVPVADARDMRVRLRCTRRWYRDVRLTIPRPKREEVRRVGAFEVVVTWPSILIRSDREVSAEALDFMLREDDIAVTVERNAPGRWPPRGCGPSVSDLLGPGESDAPVPPMAWCGCSPAPVKMARPEPTAREWNVYHEWRGNKREEVTCIELRLRVPVEETFEVASPPLR